MNFKLILALLGATTVSAVNLKLMQESVDDLPELEESEPQAIGLTEEQAAMEAEQNCMDDPNCTITFDRHTTIEGASKVVRTETTVLQVNDDGTETETVTAMQEFFVNDELLESLETVLSEETRPTETPFVEPIGLAEPVQELSVEVNDEPEEQQEATTEETTTVTTVTTTTTTTEEEEEQTMEPEEMPEEQQEETTEQTTVTTTTTTTETTEEQEDTMEPEEMAEEQQEEDAAAAAAAAAGEQEEMPDE